MGKILAPAALYFYIIFFGMHEILLVFLTLSLFQSFAQLDQLLLSG